MKRALRLSIQGFWAFFGAMSVWMLMMLIVGGGWRHQPVTLVTWIILLPIVLLIGAFIFGAWMALFRFSPGVVKPSVMVVSLILLHVALKANTTYLAPWVTSSLHSSIGGLMPLLALLALFLTVVAAVKFYGVTSAIITRLLFPELHRSAARIF